MPPVCSPQRQIFDQWRKQNENISNKPPPTGAVLKMLSWSHALW